MVQYNVLYLSVNEIVVLYAASALCEGGGGVQRVYLYNNYSLQGKIPLLISAVFIFQT